MFPESRQAGRHASAVLRARVRLLALCWLLGAAAVARAGPVLVTVDERHGAYSVAGEFRTQVPPGVAWAVLTDYDRIDLFVGSMRSSSSERRNGRLIVHQVATAGLFPLRRAVRVALEVQEEAGRHIRFHDILAKDFRSYSGEWTLATDSSGTRVTYRLEAIPRMFVPFGGRGVMSRSVRDLLSQVDAEMARRAAGMEAYPALRMPLTGEAQSPAGAEPAAPGSSGSGSAPGR